MKTWGSLGIKKSLLPGVNFIAFVLGGTQTYPELFFPHESWDFWSNGSDVFLFFFFLMSDFTRSDDSSGYFNACTKIMDLFFYFLKASLIDK